MASFYLLGVDVKLIVTNSNASVIAGVMDYVGGGLYAVHSNNLVQYIRWSPDGVTIENSHAVTYSGSARGIAFDHDWTQEDPFNGNHLSITYDRLFFVGPALSTGIFIEGFHRNMIKQIPASLISNLLGVLSDAKGLCYDGTSFYEWRRTSAVPATSPLGQWKVKSDLSGFVNIQVPNSAQRNLRDMTFDGKTMWHLISTTLAQWDFVQNKAIKNIAHGLSGVTGIAFNGKDFLVVGT